MPLDLTPQTQNVYNPGTIQEVTTTATHAETAAAVNANAVLLVSDTDCHVLFGTTPVATTGALFLPKGAMIALACQPTDKVSVIRDTADGHLWVVSLN